jgi:hypothetical protein
MLVGHFAVALVGKRIEPKISLGTLVAGAMLPDLLWPVFSMFGIECSTGSPVEAGDNVFNAPISHSLLMVAVWATLFAGGYFLWSRYLSGTLLLFAVVLSHGFLDFISHKHTLTPASHDYFGLDLWTSLPATIMVEGGFWLLAIIAYVLSTYAKSRAGIYGFWPVIVLLTFIWVTNIRTGPPPPDKVIGSLIFFLLLVAWAYWMNKVRSPKSVSFAKKSARFS